MALKVDESELGATTEFASGGMASISHLPDYFLPELPGVRLVYKKFKKKIRPVPTFSLEMLIKVRDGLHPDQRKAVDRSFSWPVQVVTDHENGAAGLVLPLLDSTYHVNLRNSYGEVKTKPAEGQFLLFDESTCRTKGIEYASRDQRLALCYSLVTGMGLLHRAEVVYGDLSLRNFLYRLSPKTTIQYVDCDAMRVAGSTSAFNLQPHTPDWEPPEAMRAKKAGDSAGFAAQSKETDRYKLGLAILRIMTPPEPSLRGGELRDPAHARRAMPGKLHTLLEQSILARPKDRPTAKDWFEEFRR